MKRKNKARKTVQRKPTLRMKRFIEGVIQEVEEAGIDDEYAVDESEPKPSASVNDSAIYARTRP